MGLNTYPSNPWPMSTDQKGGGDTYELPVASAETLGGVKVGSNLNIADGVLSGPAPYELPTASAETLGGVKVGSGLSIADGVLSVTASADLKFYRETYKGTGTILNTLPITHDPLFIISVRRADSKVVMTPFAPDQMRTTLYFSVPAFGTSAVTVINDANGVSVQGSDIPASCNALDEDYVVEYLSVESEV